MWTWWKHRLTSTQTLCYVDLMETQTDKHTDTMLCGLDGNTDWQAHRHYAMWTWWKHRLTSTQTLCYVDLMETQTDKHTDTMLCGLDGNTDWQAHRHYAMWTWWKHRLTSTQTLCYVDLMETQTDKHTDTMLCGLDVQSWAGTNSVNRSARTSRLRNTRTLCQIHVKFTDILQLAMYVSAQLQPCVRRYWRCT